MRAIVLLPAATLPAIPITYGAPACRWPRNVSVTECSSRVAATRRFNEPRQRQVHLFDLADRHRLAEAAERREIVLGQRQRRRRAQPAPLLAGEVDVRIELCLVGRVHAL